MCWMASCLCQLRSNQQNGHKPSRVKVNLSKVVHISEFTNLLENRSSELKLVMFHRICLPSNSSRSQGDPKDPSMQLTCYHDNPRLARDALVLGPSEVDIWNPTPVTVSTLLTQMHYPVFHDNPQYLNLYNWFLEFNSSKNKASLWKWQRELLPLRCHHQVLSIN